MYRRYTAFRQIIVIIYYYIIMTYVTAAMFLPHHSAADRQRVSQSQCYDEWCGGELAIIAENRKENRVPCLDMSLETDRLTACGSVVNRLIADQRPINDRLPSVRVLLEALLAIVSVTSCVVL